jgi:hypothetical protein
VSKRALNGNPGKIEAWFGDPSYSENNGRAIEPSPLLKTVDWRLEDEGPATPTV